LGSKWEIEGKERWRRRERGREKEEWKSTAVWEKRRTGSRSGHAKRRMEGTRTGLVL